jgi:hypothetical protein
MEAEQKSGRRDIQGTAIPKILDGWQVGLSNASEETMG